MLNPLNDADGFITFEDEKLLSGRVLGNLMRAVLERGKIFRFQAKGWSMAPFILDGDLISVSPLSETPPKLGDVVAFVESERNRLIVHRIVSNQPDGYLIQGDNHTENECAHTVSENILGRVTRVERAGKVIRLGLGPEKYLIALLSKKRLLQPYLTRLAPFLRPLRKVLS